MKLYEDTSGWFENKQQTVKKAQLGISWDNVHEGEQNLFDIPQNSKKVAQRKCRVRNSWHAKIATGHFRSFWQFFHGLFVLITCVFVIPVRGHSRNHPANLLAKSLSVRHRPCDKKVTLSFQPTRRVNPITQIFTYTRTDVRAKSLGVVRYVWALGNMQIVIVVIKINRSGELNPKARGSWHASLTMGQSGGRLYACTHVFVCAWKRVEAMVQTELPWSIATASHHCHQPVWRRLMGLWC